MITIDRVDVWGFEHAIRGMRNPMNSWNKSDTKTEYIEGVGSKLIIGKADLDLMRRLYRAGTEHRKYLRQIFVSMDITAPLYWWKEFDTYKVGTAANSCSTMHKIAAKEFEPMDFSNEDLTPTNKAILGTTIAALNVNRIAYLQSKDMHDWRQMIQLLPSSYNQKRTVTMNYENVVSMMKQRTGHKLKEWNAFVALLSNLPYIKEITEDAE